MNCDRGVTHIPDQCTRYQVGDLVYHIFIDPQDNRKAMSRNFPHWQGNVLVVHEVHSTIVNATEADEDMVKQAVRDTLRDYTTHP